jgi:CubicO group peptidase (beta-lactamase class C family)
VSRTAAAPLSGRPAPPEAGFGAGAVPGAVGCLAEGIARSLHRGAQLYVSRDGRAVADLSLGENRPGRPMTPDLLMPWLSAVKPVLAVALAQLWETGALDLDHSVARYLPAFAAGGKEVLTLRHLLTHGGGFRTPSIGGVSRSFEESLAKICATPLEPGWVPGERTAYQPASSWYVLGEVLTRLTGSTPARFFRERIFEPLGMASSHLGIPPERYRELAPRLGVMVRPDPGGAGGAPPRHYPWHTEPWSTRSTPAESGWGPMRELGRFYEMLLSGGAVPVEPPAEPSRLLRPETVAALLTPHHAAGSYDESLRRVVHWGLGLRVNGLTPAGRKTGSDDFGRLASLRAFGHGGFRSTTAFADPEHGLVVAFAANGLPGREEHRRRLKAVTEAVYRDLGMAGEEVP